MVKDGNGPDSTEGGRDKQWAPLDGAEPIKLTARDRINAARAAIRNKTDGGMDGPQ